MTEKVANIWRLMVEDVPSPGAWNMALDRALQLERAAGRSSATLRLYRWARPTVSLGRFQPVGGVDLDECRARGIDVVRRYTGGRGVLHDDEVTYSIVAGVGDGVPRGTAASYLHLCSALVAAYRLLGVDADVTQRSRGSRTSSACYLHATRADLSVGPNKLCGSAQVWHKDVVLQHGSFVLTRDDEREAAVFSLTSEQAAELSQTTTTLGGVLPQRPTLTIVAAALRSAVEDVFGVTLALGAPTRRECSVASALASPTALDAPGGCARTSTRVTMSLE